MKGLRAHSSGHCWDQQSGSYRKFLRWLLSCGGWDCNHLNIPGDWSMKTQTAEGLELGGIVQFSQSVSSVTRLCLTIHDPMSRSTPGLPVHHKLLEFT